MDTEAERFNPVILTSPTEIALADYLIDEKFVGIRRIVRERRIGTVGEIDISYRVFSHWDKNGLLPEGMRSSDLGWRKFNFIERVWLEVIKRLRDFGLSLDKIAKVRESIMLWHKEDDAYPEFEYFVLAAKYNPSDSYVVVFADGNAGIGVARDIELSKETWDFRDSLLISLKGVLRDIGLNARSAKPLHDLTDEETELLAQIRLDGNDELKIKTHKDGKIKEIESTSITTEPVKNYEAHKRAKERRLYGRVVTQYEDGKPKSTHVTSRKRFDK